MSALNEKLVAACRSAVSLSLLLDQDEPSHLSALRRFEEDGSETWIVFISDRFVESMTHITDALTSDNYPWVGGEVVADVIANCWDPAWDLIPSGRDGYVSRSVAEAAAA